MIYKSHRMHTTSYAGSYLYLRISTQVTHVDGETHALRLINNYEDGPSLLALRSSESGHGPLLLLL